MASAKQIKARKLFAKRAKRGDFKKAITKTKKTKAPSSKRSLEKVQREVEGMTKLKGHEKPLYGEESGGILQQDNSWHVLIDGKEYVVHLDPAYFKKYGYKVGDEVSIDAELEFFFQAMNDAGFTWKERDEMADMSHMNGTLKPKSLSEYSSR